MTLGEKIRFLRTRQNLSQEDLAKMLNTTKQAIYKYENSVVTHIPIDKIEFLSNIFEVSPSWLMGWENETPTPELTEGERAWLELYRALSPEVSELFFPVLQEFDNLPDGERQMLQAIIGTAIKNKK